MMARLTPPRLTPPRPGQLFGKLRFRRVATIPEIQATGLRSPGTYWLMDCLRCDTANVVKRAMDVRAGVTTSCGCLRKAARPAQSLRQTKDETGRRHGDFEVVRKATTADVREHKPGYKQTTWAWWWVKCRHCGKERLKPGAMLRHRDKRKKTANRCQCQIKRELRDRFIAKETGKQYGDFEVLRQATAAELAKAKPGNKNRQGYAWWWVKCRHCGKEFLKAGHTMRSAEKEALTGNCVRNICRCRLAAGFRTVAGSTIAHGGKKVVLGERGSSPIVNGKVKRPLTDAQYDVVKALVEAGEFGLSYKQLDRATGHGDTRKILERLAEADPDWRDVIEFPGKHRKGSGYRVLL